MKTTSLKLRTALLLLPAVLLAACAPAVPATLAPPTQDVAAISTGVAATIYAQLTQAVTATYTPTTPPTATATFTPLPPTANALPSPTEGTPIPTATEPIQGDAAKFSSTAPPQYAEIHPNEFYNLEFDLLNIGTTTWNPGYRLMWVGGEQFVSQTVIQLDREVPPGKKGVFILGTFGSEEWYPHTTIWQLYNDKGLPVPGGRVSFTYKPI